MRSLFLVVAAGSVLGCAHKTAAPKTEANPAASASRGDTAVLAAPLKHDAPSAATEDDCGPVRVHFALDSAQLESGEAQLLENPARCLKANHWRQAVLGGHADERGTEEYNLALGDRRARTVGEHLERLGVPGKQLEAVSRGELDPLCHEHDEACWSKNRRVSVKPK